ncbi:unnamed protein product [Rhizophagus irregularis]|nr:unnamed protein product [Rhizophagus irregularis]
MAEGVNRGVRGAFQNGGNLYSFRHRRKIDNPTGPSADSYDNDLGCCVSFVEVLHQKETKKSNTSLSYQDAKTLIKNNYDDGRGCGGSPIDDQRHIFNTNKEDHKKCTKKKKKKKKSRKEKKNTEKETYKNSTYEGQEKKRK